MAAASGAVFEVGNSFDDGVDVRHGADFDATAASTLEMVDLVLLSRLVCRELPLLGVSITRTLRRITFITSYVISLKANLVVLNQGYYYQLTKNAMISKNH